MNPAYLLAIVTSVLFGTADFLGGLAARRAPVVAVTLTSGAAGLVTLAIAALFQPGHPSPADLAWSAAAGCCGGVGIAFLYRAFAAGPVSVAAPVISLSMLAVPVLVAVATGERPSALALTGIGLAALAFPLLARGAGEGPAAARAAFRRMVRDALASGVLLGGFLVLIRRVSADAGLATLIVARLAIVVLFAAVALARRAPAWPAGAGRVTVSAGLLDALANVFYFVAVHRAALAPVATIVSLSPATTLLLARVVLAERWSLPQRVGLACAAVAIVCVTWG